jgi:hypothetical protein
MQYLLTEKEYHDLLFYKSEYERLLKEIEQMKCFIDSEPMLEINYGNSYEINRKVVVDPIGEVNVSYCRNYLRDIGKAYPIVCDVCRSDSLNSNTNKPCKFLRRQAK